MKIAPPNRTTMAVTASLIGIGALYGGKALAASTPASQTAIVGGEPVNTCNWSATALSGNFCSGTLIHPRVIISARHCEHNDETSWRFGESEEGEFSIQSEKCVNSQGRSDWSYCVLPEDPRLEALPYIPPLTGCEHEQFLKPGAKLMGVGFGATGANQEGFGTKRFVEVNLNEINGDELDVGEREHGFCNGDSGGPIFMHLQSEGKDWGWRTVGSTSGLGKGDPCAGTTTFIDAARHAAEIEKNEGIDVTPCTNEDGAWDPSPACKALPADPGNAGGQWPSCDFGPKTNVPIESCGMPNPHGAGEADGMGGGGGAGGMGDGGAAAGGMSNGGAAAGSMSAGGAAVGGMSNGGAGGGGAVGGGSPTPNGGTPPVGNPGIMPTSSVPTATPPIPPVPGSGGPSTMPTSSSDSGCSYVASEKQQHAQPYWLLGLLALVAATRRKRNPGAQ